MLDRSLSAAFGQEAEESRTLKERVQINGNVPQRITNVCMFSTCNRFNLLLASSFSN